jgi:hypothetical protein
MKINKEVSESLVTFSLAGAEDRVMYYAVLSSLQRIYPMLTLSDPIAEKMESLFHELKNVTIHEEASEYRYHFLSTAALVGLMKEYRENKIPSKNCMQYLQELLSFEMVFINDPKLTYEYKMSGKMILIDIKEGVDHHDRH